MVTSIRPESSLIRVDLTLPAEEDYTLFQMVEGPAKKDKDRLYALLKSVSRSFYLTLAILPPNIRPQIALAYLYARAADTVSDSSLIPRATRLHHLERFRQWVQDPEKNASVLPDLQQSLSPLGPQSAERTLLERLDVIRHVFETFSSEDQLRIRQVLDTLTGGMVRDLEVFPGEAEQALATLPALSDLDSYTYSVAGCVGDFWTQMICAHRPAFRDWDPHGMGKEGIHFGKGLQFANVLRDIPRDLRRGRCYIPEELLAEVGLEPADLLKPDVLQRFKPVLSQLLRVALDHLDRSWLYTMAIPRREWRVRLACIWPIFFAMKTLERISTSAHVLDPRHTIKMTRSEVYREIALSVAAFGSKTLLTAHYGRLRKRVAC
jgi:farnesyl-diphosphate farnesyltransferase